MIALVSRELSPKRIDAHVHMVGNGVAGSGGWLRLRGWHRWLAGFMLRQLGIPASALEEDLEKIYATHLAKLVRESSLDAVVLLAHERVHDSGGRPRDDLSPMFVPNDVVLGLAKNFPQFLPGVSIHPARRDALDELDRCVAAGAVLMKCLPNCQNIDFSDMSFQPFWERMAEARLPLLVHTGGEHTLPIIDPKLADPRLLRFPLERGVTVIAAHCATSSGLFDPDYFETWTGMLREFPNLYGDISAMISLNRSGHLHDCLAEEILPRILHGSDFPVPVLGHRLWLQGWIDRKAFRRCQDIRNPLERDWQFKQALGFPEEVATRAMALLRRAN
jgi:hypothetical protein